MAWTSDAKRYGTVARSMHWITALAIVGMLGSGLTAERLSGDPAAVNVLRFHAVTGVIVLALTLLRILWWVFADRRPPETAATPRWQARAAHAVHYAFYAIILMLGSSGLAMIVLSGAGNILFGAQTSPLPRFEDFVPRGPHGLFAWAMIALIAAHVGAALYHQIVLRDRLLGRMGIGPAA
jgi:cytochrome b561